MRVTLFSYLIGSLIPYPFREGKRRGKKGIGLCDCKNAIGMTNATRYQETLKALVTAICCQLRSTCQYMYFINIIHVCLYISSLRISVCVKFFCFNLFFINSILVSLRNRTLPLADWTCLQPIGSCSTIRLCLPRTTCIEWVGQRASVSVDKP
jgi:hypothetical protein